MNKSISSRSLSNYSHIKVRIKLKIPFEYINLEIYPL